MPHCHGHPTHESLQPTTYGPVPSWADLARSGLLVGLPVNHRGWRTMSCCEILKRDDEEAKEVTFKRTGDRAAILWVHTRKNPGSGTAIFKRVKNSPEDL